VWLSILISLLVILVWPLIAPLQLQIDTRVPEIRLRWVTVGKAKLVYEQEKWWLRISVFFFSKEWDLAGLGHKKKKKVREVRPRETAKKVKWLRRLINMGRSFRVTRWQVAVDTADDIKNASLYQLNFHPAFRHHLNVNFFDENYLFLQIRNTPWRMIYALMK